jgi:hypothetical protein
MTVDHVKPVIHTSPDLVVVNVEFLICRTTDTVDVEVETVGGIDVRSQSSHQS